MTRSSYLPKEVYKTNVTVPARLCFLQEKQQREFPAQKLVGRFCGTSPKAIWKTFTKTGPFPCRGCEHVSYCHSESSAGPFFPRTAHSSFPPNPKGLRGRAMTKVHATDGKRSPMGQMGRGAPVNSTALALSGGDWLPRYCCCIVIYLHVSSHTYYI